MLITSLYKGVSKGLKERGDMQHLSALTDGRASPGIPLIANKIVGL